MSMLIGQFHLPPEQATQAQQAIRNTEAQAQKNAAN
jgi:hypothetical protein